MNLFSAMRPGSEKRKIATLARTDQTHVLLQMLQAQKVGGLYHEGREGKIRRRSR